MDRKHFSIEEREVIVIQLGVGSSLRHIAAQLGRSPSTISRELRRNSAQGGYCAYGAHGQAMARRRQPRRERLMCNRRLRRYVNGKLRAYWSPEQIGRRLKIDCPHDPSMRICYETIYQFILAEACNGVNYGPYLWQGHRRKIIVPILNMNGWSSSPKATRRLARETAAKRQNRLASISRR
ncbi:MAG: helix-turn-helix domain-containing protein [Kiritimatiellales bacterium]|nr:helix-turn-helix domain-containing protein [Kiritimatiellales bacterium]